MKVSAQLKTKWSAAETCLCSVSYQAQSRILIMEFPRDGVYLYRNVPVGTFEMLKHSPVVRAAFLRTRRHNYSVVTAA